MTDTPAPAASAKASASLDEKECEMSSEFVTVAKTGDVPPGGIVAFDVAGTRVAVANVDGTFHAFDDVCTHEECSLADGDLKGTTVTCPCHLGQFDVRTGAVLAPPPRVPVKTYRVRIEGESLQIAL